MKDSPYETIPTLISLWSAMLGGAIGAAAGKLSGDLLCNGTLGFFIGGAASVLMHMLLFVPVYVVASYLLELEFGELTVGGHKADMVATVLGAVAGLVGAVAVTTVVPSQSLKEPHAFAVCWTSVTVTCVVLILGVVWRRR